MAHEVVKDQLLASIAEIKAFLQESQQEKEKFSGKISEIEKQQKRADRDMALAQQALEVLRQDDPQQVSQPQPTSVGDIARVAYGIKGIRENSSVEDSASEGKY